MLVFEKRITCFLSMSRAGIRKSQSQGENRVRDWEETKIFFCSFITCPMGMLRLCTSHKSLMTVLQAQPAYSCHLPSKAIGKRDFLQGRGWLYTGYSGIEKQFLGKIAAQSTQREFVGARMRVNNKISCTLWSRPQDLSLAHIGGHLVLSSPFHQKKDKLYQETLGMSRQF